ncbi:MAG: hypothetical protein M1817_000533 [Caeruleum heppii]|nr:MAG: hypothetical protein M1817_000533 [Caeruleum heppii]
MAEADPARDALISQFCDLTGATPPEAEQYLATNQWDLSSAAAEYYTSQEEGIAQAQEGNSPSTSLERPSPEPAASGPRTLSGAPSSTNPSTSTAPASSSQPARPTAKKKFATLGDLGQDSGHSHSGGHGNSDDDDDEDDDRKRDLFAGGGKSALAVQDPADPRNHVKDILKKAKKRVPRPGGDEATDEPPRFRGAGQTLGGDDTPSQVIPDPNASAEKPKETVTRTLHFWKDGFSIEDGHLYRFDDPANAAILRLIRTGRAPLDIMDVEPDQPVDVTVMPHEEAYVQPKAKYKPFSSGGQRLGSPTPGASSSSTSHNPAAASGASTSVTPASTSGTNVNVDEAQPIVSLQIRLTNGSRLSSRFNASHTIGDVYSFVEASGAQGSWVLMTTFPSKELTDKGVTLGSMAEFKRGGVIVQKATA